MPSARVLVTEGKTHGDRSRVQNANVLNEHAAVELLAVYPAEQFTVHDSEPAILISSVPQVPPACALVTEGIVHGDGPHVKNPNVLSEHAAVELPTVYPGEQFTVHDSDSAILVSSVPQMPPACALVTGGIVHGDGSHVKDANVPSEHAAITASLSL